MCKLCAVTVAVRSACCDLSPDPPQEIRTVFLLMPVLCPQKRMEDTPSAHPSLEISSLCSDYFSEFKKARACSSIFLSLELPLLLVVLESKGNLQDSRCKREQALCSCSTVYSQLTTEECSCQFWFRKSVKVLSGLQGL